MRKVAVVMAVLAALLPHPSRAEDLRMITPVYHQVVVQIAPDGFKPAYEQEANGSYINEMVPDGETVDDWHQMITLTGERDLLAHASLLDYANTFAAGYAKACPDSFVATALDGPAIAGAQQTLAAYIGCGAVDGLSETALVVMIAGRQDLYTVQWAERTPALDGAPQYDPARWDARLQTLSQTRLCDPAQGEAAPYPSCLK